MAENDRYERYVTRILEKAGVADFLTSAAVYILGTSVISFPAVFTDVWDALTHRQDSDGQNAISVKMAQLMAYVFPDAVTVGGGTDSPSPINLYIDGGYEAFDGGNTSDGRIAAFRAFIDGQTSPAYSSPHSGGSALTDPLADLIEWAVDNL
jgi:hypothetical protein